MRYILLPSKTTINFIPFESPVGKQWMPAATSYTLRGWIWSTISLVSAVSFLGYFGTRSVVCHESSTFWGGNSHGYPNPRSLQKPRFDSLSPTLPRDGGIPLAKGIQILFPKDHYSEWVFSWLGSLVVLIFKTARAVNVLSNSSQTANGHHRA